ncbi:MAG: hypothetical protein IPK70_01285 [Flavobacteriales bacterium]|nr:hypothetical protein [Flavobacteriales bacterium]
MRGERLACIAVGLAAFLYLFLRAAFVPLTHDEAATFQTYVLTGDYLPYLAHWDAGNHLLSTAVTRAAYLLFGPSPLALRAFSLIGFLLWALYAWRITRPIENGLIRMSTVVALLLTPFVIEFFALFRGYGPSLAFLLMALHHLLRLLVHARRTDLLLILVAALLACVASLTLLIAWCMILAATVAIVFRSLRRDARAWLAVIMLGAVPLVLAAQYSFELSARGLLYFGTDAGLVNGTMASLGRWALGVDAPRLGAALILLPLPVGMLALRTGHHRTEIGALLLLIIGELLGRFVLAEAFDVLYPQDRTAMHLVPVLLLLSVFSVDALTQDRPWMRWAALLVLALPIRTVLFANLDRTAYWPEQAIPAEVFDAVERLQQHSARPLLIGGYHQNAAVWAFGSMRHGGTLPFLDSDGFPQPTCDLLLIDPTYFKAPAGFSTITSAPHGKLALMQRDEPLSTLLLLDTAFTIVETDAEFVELLVAEDAALDSGEWLIELHAELHSASAPLDLRFVVELKDADGGTLHYDVVDAQRLRTHWQGESWRLIRRVPLQDHASTRRVCYFWNPKRHSFKAPSVRLKVHRLESAR